MKLCAIERTRQIGLSMSNELKTFPFKHQAVRVVVIDGEPWFLAVDVARVLGLGAKQGATSQYLRNLDADQVRNVGRSMVDKVHVSFPNRGAAAISESGLYLLTLRSNKPEAKPFQDWVTREVLPAIRKTGG